MSVTVTVTERHKGIVYEVVGPWQVAAVTSRRCNVVLAVTGTQERAVLLALLDAVAKLRLTADSRSSKSSATRCRRKS